MRFSMISFQEYVAICEGYGAQDKFVIFRTATRSVLGTVVGFEQAKSKATEIRKQRGLKFDDVSFMTSKRFYGKTSAAPSGGRRIEYAPLYNPSKRGRFRGVWDDQGNYADLD